MGNQTDEQMIEQTGTMQVLASEDAEQVDEQTERERRKYVERLHTLSDADLIAELRFQSDEATPLQIARNDAGLLGQHEINRVVDDKIWRMEAVQAVIEERNRRREVGAPIMVLPGDAVVLSDLRAAIVNILTDKNNHQRFESVSQAVLKTLCDNGEFFHDAEANTFYFAKSDAHLYSMEGDWFTSWLSSNTGINRTNKLFDHVLDDLKVYALQHAREVTPRRWLFFDKDRLALYLSVGLNALYRVTTQSIERLPNGTDGVLFLDNAVSEDFALPETSKFIWDCWFVRDADFDAEGLSNEQARLALRLWALGVLFNEIHPTKPILFFSGEAGSGKTSEARALPLMLFGRATLNGIEEYKERDFWTIVSHHVVAVFDNVDSYIRWLPDALSAVATGGEREVRQLYKTDTVHRMRANCWQVLTSREPHFRRDDVVDRMIVLKFNRRPIHRPESDLMEETLRDRPAVLRGLIEEARALLAYVEAHGWSSYGGEVRMADWARFCTTWGDCFGQRTEVDAMLAALERRKEAFALEDDPAFLALAEWFHQNPDGVIKEKKAYALFAMLCAVAERAGVEVKKNAAGDVVTFGRFKSSLSFARHFKHIVHALRSEFDIVDGLDPTDNVQRYTIRLR